MTLAGVSIGGVIPLVMAARGNARIARVVSINPYDYGEGLGLARSSLFGWIVTHVARVPVLGEIIIPLAPRWLIRQVDAVIATSSISASYLKRESTVVMHGVDTDTYAPPADRAVAAESAGAGVLGKFIVLVLPGLPGRVRLSRSLHSMSPRDSSTANATSPSAPRASSI